MTRISAELYAATMDNGLDNVETVTERLERELFFTRKLYASLFRDAQEAHRDVDPDMQPIYAQEITDLRCALAALYQRRAP